MKKGENLSKKIVLLTGSGHHPGTSEALADVFERGALAAGHQVVRFNAGDVPVDFLKLAADQTVLPSQDQVATTVLPQVLAAEVIVLVTPLYYFGMTAQLKAVVDRFYTYNHALKDKQCVLLATAHRGPEAFATLRSFYRQFTQYMRWESLGEVLADTVRTPAELGDWPAKAEALGQHLT